MKNLDELTVVIVTFNTPEKIILDCLRSINKNVKVLIIENSKKFFHEEIINTEFSNVKVICTGENLGYGKGNNFGIKHVKSNYVLILNPDTICDENFFSNIPEVVNEAKNFSIIGCQYSFDKTFMPAGFFNREKNNEFSKNFKDKKVASISNVEWVTGCSMLLNLKNFSNKEVFDRNYFLYFEEFDLCKSVVNSGNYIFTSEKLKIHHLGFKGSLNNDQKMNSKMFNVKDWHYMWSSFYFYKKNYSYMYALYKYLGKFLKSFLKVIFYTITLQKKSKNKYLYRFLGLLNSILCKPSNFRG
tara:strand:- start:1714 stop:2613 length:900 start_codon:yes stop_codon:yes gene_type:complete